MNSAEGVSMENIIIKYPLNNAKGTQLIYLTIYQERGHLCDCVS